LKSSRASSMSKLTWSLMSPSICYMSWNLARKSSENSSKDHPYSIWVVVKEVITERCFWFRVDAQRSLWKFQCRNTRCMDKNG
jgi:hypothetical protein